MSIENEHCGSNLNREGYRGRNWDVRLGMLGIKVGIHFTEQGASRENHPMWVIIPFRFPNGKGFLEAPPMTP